MTESPNIDFNQPVQRKKYSSFQRRDIGQDTTPEKRAENAPKKRHEPPSLKVYGAGGAVRSEQPAALGGHIDIII